jgi:endonuclease/exonuclease/phosphatase family metal-dependent hydrolase
MRILIAAMIVGMAAGPAMAEPVRVMTFNVRYASAPDGENAWAKRREQLVSTIKKFDPDVLGLQEAEQSQIDELAKALPQMSSIGVGREANGGGEYSAIFYRRSRFDLMAADTFWLSATPESPGSRTWGNTLPRIVTWARFLDRIDRRRISIFNTHWDHQSEPARLASAALLAERVAARIAVGEPVLITGDFNSAEDSPAILSLTRHGDLVRDTFRKVHADEIAGTAHGFSGQAGSRKIDAVFACDRWQVADASIVRTSDEGRYPSDHFPVTAVVEVAEE